MVLPDSYSRRKRLAGDGLSRTDVYAYDEIPARVRVQTSQIIADAIGPSHDDNRAHSAYEYIVTQTRREIGVHDLNYENTYSSELFRWMETTSEVDDWLDAVELSLRMIERVVVGWGADTDRRRSSPKQAVAEFNARCKEAAFGYQFIDGDIVRVDSQHLHKDVVVPTLALLRDPRFAAAEQEYRSAHHAFRNGELEDCLVDCAKSFESVLKVIGGERGWSITSNDPASKLIDAATQAGFLGAHSTALNHLVGMLKSSTPTTRNKFGGHGAGAVPRSVGVELAALQLHQTAANILYLVEHDAALTKAGGS